MENGQVTEQDLLKAYIHLYETSQTTEYKAQLIWFLDRSHPRISDKLRQKLGITLERV